VTGSEQWQAPSPTGDGREARQQPEDTGDQKVADWQRQLRWVAWLTFLGLAVYYSQSVYFSAPEWLALAAAIGISIWCLAKPLGGPKYELRKPSHLLGAFVSRTSWGLVLFGALLTLGGVAGSRPRSTTSPRDERPSVTSSRTSGSSSRAGSPR
jgi:hypothetical protein